MGRLDTLEEQVRAVLKAYPKTRDDDRELTFMVYTQIYGKNPWSPMIEIMRDKDLPSQESIGRVRRKIQQTDERLRGTKKKEAIRMEAQADYIEFALSDRSGDRL
jgi:hypothetical protein